MALANAERQARYRSGGRLASPGVRYPGRRTGGLAATERRPHEEQPGATRQPVSVRLLRRRRACRLREPQLAESLAGSTTRALLEQVCNLDRCTLRTHGCHGGGTGRISGTEWEGPTAQRRCAPTSVPLRRNPCSTSPECVFHFTEIRTQLASQSRTRQQGGPQRRSRLHRGIRPSLASRVRACGEYSACPCCRRRSMT